MHMLFCVRLGQMWSFNLSAQKKKTPPDHNISSLDTTAEIGSACQGPAEKMHGWSKRKGQNERLEKSNSS